MRIIDCLISQKSYRKHVHPMKESLTILIAMTCKDIQVRINREIVPPNSQGLGIISLFFLYHYALSKINIRAAVC